MRYAIYDKITGEISQFIHTEDTCPEPPEGSDSLAVGDEVRAETHLVDVTGDSLAPVERAEGSIPEVLAAWKDIKAHRSVFEQLPVDTPHGYLDADADSMERLRLAIKQFLFLPTVQNGKLAWKMADNTIELFTYIELQGLYEEADKARSIRAAYLHVRAEELAAMEPAPTLDFISDINNWIEP